MSPHRWLPAAFLAFVLAGCASLSEIPGAGSGVSPGGFRDDDSYELTETERSLSCARMGQAELSLAEDMKKHMAQAKAEREAAAPTALNFLKRTFGGGGDGLAALEDFKRKSAMADAYAVEKSRRNCPPDTNAAVLAGVRSETDAFTRSR